MATTAQNSNERKRIKKLEKLLAQEIQKVADLLKENQALELKLKNLKCQRSAWRRYEKSNKNKRALCDRSNAMIVHGEIDISEALHSDK